MKTMKNANIIKLSPRLLEISLLENGIKCAICANRVLISACLFFQVAGDFKMTKGSWQDCAHLLGMH